MQSQMLWKESKMTIEEKLSLIPTEYKTASQIGLAAATLGALARRGLVEVLDTVPKQYRKVGGNVSKIYELIAQNKDDYDTYFCLRKTGKKVGMLCSFSKDKILDCWGNPYDLTGVNQIDFNTRTFYI